MMTLFLLLIAIFLVVLIHTITIHYSRPSFTTVKKYELSVLTDSQRQLYEALVARRYYVSCGLKLNFVFIPLALEPFRVAFIEQKPKTFPSQFSLLYLKLKGWHVVSFSVKASPEDMTNMLDDIDTRNFLPSGHLKHVK